MQRTGKIKWYDPIKGYGFITKADGQDVFVHKVAVREARIMVLNPGDEVSFVEIDTDRGPKAEKVKLISALQVAPH